MMKIVLACSAVAVAALVAVGIVWLPGSDPAAARAVVGASLASPAVDTAAVMRSASHDLPVEGWSMF